MVPELTNFGLAIAPLGSYVAPTRRALHPDAAAAVPDDPRRCGKCKPGRVICRDLPIDPSFNAVEEGF